MQARRRLSTDTNRDEELARARARARLRGKLLRSISCPQHLSHLCVITSLLYRIIRARFVKASSTILHCYSRESRIYLLLEKTFEDMLKYALRIIRAPRMYSNLPSSVQQPRSVTTLG